jgi:hypothetical protein
MFFDLWRGTARIAQAGAADAGRLDSLGRS